MSYKRRMKQTELEINAAYPDRASRLKRQGEAVLVDAEFWDNVEDAFFSGAQFKILKGDLPIKRWIEDSGLEKCKKYEATSLLTVGKKEIGCFVVGHYKNYWLRPKRVQ